MIAEPGPDAALVLFSGGQDSTVCLAWALQRFARVETVGFDYGQRHAVELAVRPRLRQKLAALRADWAARLGEDHVLKLDALGAISDTALTRETTIEMAASGLPTTFVPGRNLAFSHLPVRSPIVAGFGIWSPACARPIIPDIPTAATTPSKPCRWRSGSAWSAALSFTRR
jgi:hypothetical protein